MPPTISPLAALVRRHDPDRFLAALFAAPDRREVLFLLYAFNHELARTSEVTSQPILALIRLQWWREVVEGVARRHEVAGPLGEALTAGLLDRADLLEMIEGREAEAEAPIATLVEWRDMVSRCAGGVAVATGRALGGEGATLERLRALGMAYGIGGQLRSVAVLAGQGRCLLPVDVLAAHGLSVEAVIAAPQAPALLPVLRVLATEGQALLRAGGGRLPLKVLAAALPAVLARGDLRRVGEPARPRGLGARLAVAVAALIRRV
jgi:phytoene synthase